MFNQSEDIKVGYIGKLECVYSQRSHYENFDKEPIIFCANRTKLDKTTEEKELYAFSELCMFDIFIHNIRFFMLVEIMLMVQISHMKCANKL